jgi:hypothetical protein
MYSTFVIQLQVVADALVAVMPSMTDMPESISNIAGLPVGRVAALRVAFAYASWCPRPVVRFLIRHVDCVLDYATVQIPVACIVIDDQHNLVGPPSRFAPQQKQPCPLATYTSTAALRGSSRLSRQR